MSIGTPTKILALDPGFDRCGVAVLERGRGEIKLLFSTCLTTNPKQSFAERLLAVGQEVERALKKWRPKVVALEKLFFATNRKTAAQVSEVRGMLIYLAAKNHLPVVEYTPLQVKQTITGFGQADKKQVALMVGRLIKLDSRARGDDEIDAIAVGLTALARGLSTI